MSIEFSIVLLRAPTGELLGAADIMQDVTARWEQQKELTKRLTALEAKLEQVDKSASHEQRRLLIRMAKKRIKALVFDAYGTLFDVHSVISACDQSFPGHGAALSH